MIILGHVCNFAGRTGAKSGEVFFGQMVGQSDGWMVGRRTDGSFYFALETPPIRLEVDKVFFYFELFPGKIQKHRLAKAKHGHFHIQHF